VRALTPYEPGNDPPLWEHDITLQASWVKIERFPCLDEWIRGVSVYRTKSPAPLCYRVVFDQCTPPVLFRIPSTVYDPRLFLHRFGDRLVEFGFLLPAMGKVQGWHQELPLPSGLRIYRSNPDHVIYDLRGLVT
jgi:hypothetical protein